jgi:SAM-dependent methyltransferase
MAERGRGGERSPAIDPRPLEPLRLLLHDDQALAVMERILLRTYSTLLGPGGRAFAEAYFARLRGLSASASLEELGELALAMRVLFRRSRLEERYRRFRRENLRTSIALIESGLLRGTVADIGAHDNVLGDVLVAERPEVDVVIGLDVRSSAPLVRPPSLQFRQLETRTELPLPTGSMDGVVCRYSLHHMPLREQRAILRETHRVLLPTGASVIFENSYSLTRSPLAPDPYGLHADVVRLGDARRIELLLAALDVFSLGIKPKPMEFPRTFRSIEGWLDEFAASGLAVADVRYYGVPLYDLHQAPLAVFVLSRA